MILCNVLMILCNVMVILCNALVIFCNVFMIFCNVLVILCNVLVILSIAWNGVAQRLEHLTREEFESQFIQLFKRVPDKKH